MIPINISIEKALQVIFAKKIVKYFYFTIYQVDKPRGINLLPARIADQREIKIIMLNFVDLLNPTFNIESWLSKVHGIDMEKTWDDWKIDLTILIKTPVEVLSWINIDKFFSQYVLARCAWAVGISSLIEARKPFKQIRPKRQEFLARKMLR